MRLGAAYSYRQWVLIWIVLVALLHGVILLRHHLLSEQSSAATAPNPIAPASADLDGSEPHLAQSEPSERQRAREGRSDSTGPRTGRRGPFPSLILLVASLTPAG